MSFDVSFLIYRKYGQQSQLYTIYTISMASVLRKILNLIIILKLYYIYPSLATLKTFLGITKQCQMEWARLTFNYLRVKLRELRGHTPLKQGKVMVYANHRSQADFFLHNVILNYQTNFLSRLAVLIASPGFVVSYRSVWFFNRNNKTDPEKFNSWLDKKFRQSPRPALLVYPEGHRMQGSEKVDPTKIKTGMIKYAYRRKMPSQILMTFGNEEILDQKKLHVAFDQTCCYKMSEVIDPSDFQTEAEYIQKIKERFCQFFDEIYAEYLAQKQKDKKQGAKDAQKQTLMSKQ